MVAILTETKNAMIKQYTKLFSMEGVRLSVTKDALRALAAQAVTKGTGARALRSMWSGSCSRSCTKFRAARTSRR